MMFIFVEGIGIMVEKKERESNYFGVELYMGIGINSDK